MPIPANNYPQPNLAPFWGGVLAIGILCLLAIWSGASGSAYGINDPVRSGVVVGLDNPLHANGDYSPSVKRFYSRHQDQPTSVKDPEPFWTLSSSELIHFGSVFLSGEKVFYIYLPHACLHKLQALNVPRAPPLA